MTIEQAREEINRCSQLKKRVNFLELRLKYKEASGDFDLNEVKTELAKTKKIAEKYTEKITDRIRRGTFVKISDEQFLILKYVDGYSNKQIAEMLNKQIGTTKTLIHNSLLKYANSYDKPLR